MALDLQESLNPVPNESLLPLRRLDYMLEMTSQVNHFATGLGFGPTMKSEAQRIGFLPLDFGVS